MIVAPSSRHDSNHPIRRLASPQPRIAAMLATAVPLVPSPALRLASPEIGGDGMNDGSRRSGRGTGRPWRIAPLAILLLAGCQKSRAVEEDAQQTVNQLKRAAEAGKQMTVDPSAGPMTRLSAIVGNMILADTKGFSAAASEAGMAQLISLEGLTVRSPVLDHCERIDALGPRAKALAGRYPVYLETVRAEGGKLVAQGELPQAEVDGMIRGMSRSQQAFSRQWTLGGELAGQAGQLCRVLARRNWSNAAGGQVRFDNESDLAEATAIRARIEVVMNEVNRISSNARANSAEAMKKLEGL